MRTWQDWETIHQPYEFDHWTKRGGIDWCASDEFWPYWDEIMEFVEPKGECLDIGCGARPCFGEGSTAIDPLIDRYKEVTPPEWWEGVEAYSQPAEKFVTDIGPFNTVMCWNALDHAIGWQQILSNISNYGAQNATYAIATDIRPPTFGHPGFERDEFFSEIEKHFAVAKYAENFRGRHVALAMK